MGEVEITIDGCSLAIRILSVRAQLGREWAEDLLLVKEANDQILTSYNQKLLNSQQEKTESTKLDGIYKREQSRENQAFERGSVYLLNNHLSFSDVASSPLRSTNFDLLFLLATQESIHRVLVSYSKAGDEKKVPFVWLIDHYKSSLDTFFLGNQRFGRADDFLDDLLLTPPSLKKGEDGKEDIINSVGEVAMEWREQMLLIPEKQEDFRKQLFVRQMANSLGPSDTKTDTETPEKDCTEEDNTFE